MSGYPFPRLDLSLLLLRLCFGGLMIINHGLPKLAKLMGPGPVKFGDPIGLGAETSLGLAVFAEVGCAALLALGLFTRWASIPLIITMLVAAFIAHGTDPFADKEGALLFLIPYLCLLMLGPGAYSIDEQWKRRKI